jgi:peptidoglycan hydrolase-like protein with peptidoglycan-binding domain
MIKTIIKGAAVAVFALAITATPFVGRTASAQVAGQSIQTCDGRTYRYGSGFGTANGDSCVKVIQQFMNEALLLYVAHGQYVASGWKMITVDGKYGDDTVAAVKRYQMSNPFLRAAGPSYWDGVVGPATWGVMKGECLNRWVLDWRHWSKTCNLS